MDLSRSGAASESRPAPSPGDLKARADRAHLDAPDVEKQYREAIAADAEGEGPLQRELARLQAAHAVLSQALD